jgi:Na+-translocating ferredoxin:NAD+ oxidoreductase RnfD subunit
MVAPQAEDVSDATVIASTDTFGHTIRVGQRTYPVVLPNPRDSRLHVAAVVISIHILGQAVLGFRVSVPQILAAIGSCFVVEVVIVFVRDRRLVWPASAMLTGSGVGLILHVVGMKAGSHWSFDRWYLFAGVAVLSLLTKYTIRSQERQVFNPSNVGLVVAFVLLGSGRIEPLHLWWRRLDAVMLLAYGIILVGGAIVAHRLRMLGLLAAFWLTLAAGLMSLASGGHCMLTPQSVTPVCGSQFWWFVAVSPEVLIFAFFMLSDPKTVPTSRQARLRYGIFVGAVCVLLMALQTNEFRTKVALLGGLALCSLARLFMPRVFWSGAPELDPFRSLSGQGTFWQNVAPRHVVAAVLGTGSWMIIVNALGWLVMNGPLTPQGG